MIFPNARLFDLAVSDDDETVVVVGRRDRRGALVGVVSVINWKTRAVVFEVTGLQHSGLCVKRVGAPRGGGDCFFVVTFSDGSLRLFRQDVTTKALRDVGGAAPNAVDPWGSMATNNTGSVLVTAPPPPSLREPACVWDVDMARATLTLSALGAAGGTLQQRTRAVHAVAWSPTEEHLLATGGMNDSHVCLFDMRAGGAPVATIRTAATAAEYPPVWCIAFDPYNGATIAVGDFRQVARWDVRAPHGAIGTPTNAHDDGAVVCAQYSPCGAVLATGGGDGAVKLWDATGAELAPLANDPVMKGRSDLIVGKIEFPPSDRSLLSLSNTGDALWQWNVPECASGLPFEGPSPPSSPPLPLPFQ